MKRHEELEAALVVIGVFAFALLALVFIVKWDNITYCCRETCLAFRSCFRDSAESIHSYSNLNELLFDSDEKRGATLHTRRGDVEDKETIVVDNFFPYVLGSYSKKKNTSRSEDPLPDIIDTNF